MKKICLFIALTSIASTLRAEPTPCEPKLVIVCSWSTHDHQDQSEGGHLDVERLCSGLGYRVTSKDYVSYGDVNPRKHYYKKITDAVSSLDVTNTEIAVDSSQISFVLKKDESGNWSTGDNSHHYSCGVAKELY